MSESKHAGKYFGGKTTVFDGAIGTELLLRGAEMIVPGTVQDSEDDYWTGQAVVSSRDILTSIHEDYLRAGANVITANTFRTNVRAVRGAATRLSSDELTARAVSIAREARDRLAPNARVAGSVGPVESCYEPARVPSDTELHAEHAAMISSLARAKVDLVLIETMNSQREAMVAAEEAAAHGIPFLVSFVLGPPGDTLLSGEPLAKAAEAVLRYQPVAILVNCISTSMVPRALASLERSLRGTNLPYGAQPNLEKPLGPGGLPGGLSPETFAALAKEWLDLGATILGGCCGTSPKYTSAISRFSTET